MEKKEKIGERELDKVTGGATVVEIHAAELIAPRCFSCRSTNVDVEKQGAYVTVTCKDCGAVDVRKA